MKIIQGTELVGYLVFPTDLPGDFRKVPDWIRTIKFRSISSIFESAPSIPFSVVLNSWEIFLVTLPSISSEAWGYNPHRSWEYSCLLTCCFQYVLFGFLVYCNQIFPFCQHCHWKKNSIVLNNEIIYQLSVKTSDRKKNELWLIITISTLIVSLSLLDSLTNAFFLATNIFVQTLSQSRF